MYCDRFLLWCWWFLELITLLIWEYFTDYLLCAGDLELDCRPFPHCIIRNFLRSNIFIESLQSELMGLNFHEKSNDLYKFKQVTDFAPDMSTCLKVLIYLFSFAVLLFRYSQMTWGGEQSHTLLDWGKEKRHWRWQVPYITVKITVKNFLNHMVTEHSIYIYIYI